MLPLRLQIRSLRKAFGANLVLQDLELELAPGEIHALIGGNGAGKSTLSKIVAGLMPADAGEILLDGARFAPASRREAQAAGVVMVLQELSVLPTLSVAENLFLGDLPSRGGLLDRPRLLREARVALARVGLERVDPAASAGTLGVGHQQLVEIAAGLAKECRVLILDEPTAALSGAETKTLFDLLRALRAAGTSVLYISHRLEELEPLADRVSVLRDGKLVATVGARDTSRQELIRLMAGAMSSRPPAAALRRSADTWALRVRGLRVGSAVRGVDLEVGQGEIVGLGGLVGAGRTELLRAVFGADARSAGEVFLSGESRAFAPATTGEAVARGIGFVPEDRKHHGIFSSLAVRVNAGIAALPRRRAWSGLVDTGAEPGIMADLLDRLQVRFAGLEQPIAQLSGGNQQKIVIGRWLRRDMRLWLLDEPTRGVDVAAREGIYSLLRAQADAGAGLLVASSDYEELAQLCDRVLVMSNGRITGAFTRETLNSEAFMAAAFAGFASGN